MPSPHARAAIARVIVPAPNAGEAALAEGLEVLAVPHMEALVELLHGRWTPVPAVAAPDAPEAPSAGPDLSEVRGQRDAKRALEIAAAGGHNLLMVGPPGAGKTMLARRMPGILPPPDFDEALDITRVHSVAGLGDGELARERPFRSPHHTISPQGLVGGGTRPRPGEVTLAHRGVLFLDELGEFSRPALEALRQPLEEGRVDIVRGQRSVSFPARAALVAACNPCPCGATAAGCRCGELERARYQRRLSGPLLDRIDLVCQVMPPPAQDLVDSCPGTGEDSGSVRARVVAARAIQAARLGGSGATCNGEMDTATARRHVHVGQGSRRRLIRSLEAGALSGRGHARVLRLARTIADLGGRDRVTAADLDEALGYRLVPPELAIA